MSVAETVDDRAIRPVVALACVDEVGEFIMQRLQFSLFLRYLLQPPCGYSFHVGTRTVLVLV